MKKIGVIVGSLRKDSWNRKVALELIKLAPASLKLEIVDISQLSLYNEDLENQQPPRSWIDFREQMKKFDGVIFSTPEYNRSMPAVIKNAVDVGSRPYGKSIWKGKPVAVISASPGAIGGFGANQHLRQTFVFLDMPCMQQPEAYLSKVDQLFEGSDLKDESTRDFLRKYIENYAKWVDQITK